MYRVYDIFFSIKCTIKILPVQHEIYPSVDDLVADVAYISSTYSSCYADRFVLPTQNTMNSIILYAWDQLKNTNCNTEYNLKAHSKYCGATFFLHTTPSNTILRTVSITHAPFAPVREVR